jgi:predicted DNA-binding ribbon-helix-helix protein
VTKRSVTVAGHRTSVSLEEPFWQALAEVAAARRSSVAAVIAAIDRGRPPGTNLSAAVRLFVLDFYRERAAGRGNPPR